MGEARDTPSHARTHAHARTQTQTHTPALSDLDGHGAGDDVSGGQVFGVGRVALHEALPLAVDKDSALATATLCDQAARAIDT